MDDLLVHTGVMDCVDSRSVGILPGMCASVKPHAVHLSTSGGDSLQDSEDVRLTNDKTVMGGNNQPARQVNQGT